MRNLENNQIYCKNIHGKEFTVEEYADFMWNGEAYDCLNCPENRGNKGNTGRYDCGQQSCWLVAHKNHKGV